MSRLENWSISVYKDEHNLYQAPETLQKCVTGFLHDDPRLETGEIRGDSLMRTSPILTLDFAARVVQTRNTCYRLGMPDPAYIAWVKEHTPRLYPALVRGPALPAVKTK